MRKKYNTPHRSRVVKTRLSEDEYADFTARLAPLIPAALMRQERRSRPCERNTTHPTAAAL